MSKCIVYIDAGHGGKDSGAVNRMLGFRECDIVLSQAKTLVDELNSNYAGVEARLTRSSDRFLTLSERPRIANANEADVFISLHCNSAENKSASGWEVFSTRGSTRSDKLATCVGEAYAKIHPHQRQRSDWSDGDLDKEANYTVITGTDHPAILFELGFISNPHEALMLVNDDYKNLTAKSLAEGVANFKGLKRKELPIPVGAETLQTLTRDQKVDQMWQYFSQNVVK